MSVLIYESKIVIKFLNLRLPILKLNYFYQTIPNNEYSPKEIELLSMKSLPIQRKRSYILEQDRKCPNYERNIQTLSKSVKKISTIYTI